MKRRTFIKMVGGISVLSLSPGLIAKQKQNETIVEVEEHRGCNGLAQYKFEGLEIGDVVRAYIDPLVSTDILFEGIYKGVGDITVYAPVGVHCSLWVFNEMDGFHWTLGAITATGPYKNRVVINRPDVQVIFEGRNYLNLSHPLLAVHKNSSDW